MTPNKKLKRKLTFLALCSTVVLSNLGFIPSNAYAVINNPLLSVDEQVTLLPARQLSAEEVSVNSPATAETGVFINPGFDTYSGTNGIADGWSTYSTAADLQVVTSPVHQGVRAQKISASGLILNQHADVHQLVAVEPGVQYAVSGMFNVESLNNATAQLYIEYFDAAGTRIGAASTTQEAATSGYIKLDNVHVTPVNATSMCVYAMVRATANDGAGSIYVDNMVIRKTTSALDNAGFETYTGTNGVADSWSVTVPANAVSNLAVVNTPLAEGIHAQKVSGSNLNTGDAIHVNQTISAEPNTSYTVTGKFNITDLDQAKVQFYLDCYDVSGHWLQAYPVDYTTSTNGYIELKNENRTSAGTAYLRIYAVLRATGDGASGTFYVDDLKVAKSVPVQDARSLIPLMTSATTPLGVISSSYSGVAYHHAFDRNPATSWFDHSAQCWIQYDFGTPAVVNEYSILPQSDRTADTPKDWNFQALDGTKWVDLDSRTLTKWPANIKQTFTISNTKAYQTYRLLSTSHNGSMTIISEMEMFGTYAVPVAPSGLYNVKNEDGAVSLTWLPLNGVTGYNLYQNGVKINQAPITTPSYKVTNLQNGKVYSYQVTAFNEAGESVKSQAVLAMPYVEDLVPMMTSDSAPSGLVSTNSPYGGSNGNGYLAFDKKDWTGWRGKTESGNFLQYEFPSPAIVRQYTILPTSSSADIRYTPKTWKLMAFDGVSWNIIDSRTETNWTASGRKYFTFQNDQAYKKYQLVLQDSNAGPFTYADIIEMQLIGSDPNPVAP